MNDKKRVLIVDDNHDTLDFLELFLFQDFEVFTALNGFEGIRMAKELVPDCIITDIMMSGMDGIALFNNLKKTDTLSDIPVIAATSFVKKLNARSLMNMGFNDVVPKPFTKTTILEKVKTAIKNKTGKK